MHLGVVERIVKFLTAARHCSPVSSPYFLMAELFLHHTSASGWTSGPLSWARAKNCSRSRRRLLCQRGEFEGDITSLRSGCMGTDKSSNGRDMRNQGQNGSQTRVQASFEELAHNQVNYQGLEKCYHVCFLSFFFLLNC